MPNVCQLSRRWHQQFSSSVKFVGHQKCLQQWQPVRHYRQPAAKKPAVRQAGPGRPTTPLKVREYEQYGSDVASRRPVQPDPLDREADDIKAQLDELNQELNSMRQGPFGPNNQILQSLSADERNHLLKVLDAQGLGAVAGEDMFSEDDLEQAIQEEEAQETTTSLAVTLRIPVRDKAYVRQFNDALTKTQENEGDLRYHLALWKWYLRCQQKVTGFSSFVSEDVWNFLWESQQKLYPRSRHVLMLVNDMQTAGVVLESRQILDYIETLHSTGNTSTAIQKWEDVQSELRHEDRLVKQKSCEVGIQLYSAVGRPHKAQELAVKSVRDGVVDGRIFIPVIVAWTESRNETARSRLWYCYLKLKELYQKQGIPLDILGEISSVLLKAGRQDMALAVFKDMLASQREDRKDSMQVYTELLHRLNNVEEGSVNENNINRIGLQALLTFPSQLKNKFFFGAWIKWLIGDGKVDDAASVVELMQEHGVKPDAKHLTGIVSAWFREGSDEACDKAERLAWAMIDARVKFVEARNQSQQNQTASENVLLSDESIVNTRHPPRYMQRDIPPATIETFSVLLLHYVQLADVKNAENVTQVMVGPAQIKANSFILNHWLYLSLRKSDLMAMWDRFCDLKSEIEPDLETFAALWDGSKTNLDRTYSIHSREYPNPRQLFNEMLVWLRKLNPKRQQDAFSSFSRDFYEQIIRCFCLSTDLPGTYVALQAIRDSFQVLPHDNIERMVLMQVARMVPGQTKLASKPRRAAIRRRDSDYRAALGDFSRTIESIRDDQAVELIAEGVNPSELDNRESGAAQALRLDAISTFLAMVMQQQMKQDGNLANDIRMAAKSMNVASDEEQLLDGVRRAQASNSDSPTSS